MQFKNFYKTLRYLRRTPFLATALAAAMQLPVAHAAQKATPGACGDGARVTRSPLHTHEPEFLGKTYDLHYDNDFHVVDTFGRDDKLSFTVMSGPNSGRHGTVKYQWRPIAPHIYAISWVEDNGGTIVHIDDFQRQVSRSYYTPHSGVLVYSEAVIR